MSETMFRSVEIRYTQALWYAWGVIDGGGAPGLTVEDGWKFAEQQREAQRSFDDGKRSVLPSMAQAWRSYVREQAAARV